MKPIYKILIADDRLSNLKAAVSKVQSIFSTYSIDEKIVYIEENDRIGYKNIAYQDKKEILKEFDCLIVDLAWTDQDDISGLSLCKLLREFEIKEPPLLKRFTVVYSVHNQEYLNAYAKDALQSENLNIEQVKEWVVDYWSDKIPTEDQEDKKFKQGILKHFGQKVRYILRIADRESLFAFRKEASKPNADKRTIGYMNIKMHDNSEIRAYDLFQYIPFNQDFLANVCKAIDESLSMKFLSVATEWFSKKGGVSSFNRGLCKALAEAGHKVTCIVPDITQAEISDAKEKNVTLISAAKMPGMSEESRLSLRPELPNDFYPEIVLGHDRHTGPASEALADNFFRGAKKIIFIHTAPGEIESYKKDKKRSAAREAEKREQIQMDLAEKAHLTFAVGPRLYREFSTLMSGRPDHPPIHEIIPGMEQLEEISHPLPPNYWALLLGRAEDVELKGLDIAARAFGLLSHSFEQNGSISLIIRGAEIGTSNRLKKDLEKISKSKIEIIRIKEYTENIDRLKENLLQASLLLMPSKKEGFGLVGIEAIEVGTPILISDQSGLASLLREYLKDEANLYYIVPVTNDLEKDAEEWKRRIEIIFMDRNAAFKRAKELKEKLKYVLCWKKAAAKLCDAVREITIRNVENNIL